MLGIVAIGGILHYFQKKPHKTEILYTEEKNSWKLHPIDFLLISRHSYFVTYILKTLGHIEMFLVYYSSILIG